MPDDRRHYVNRAKELLRDKQRGLISDEEMLEYMDSLEITNEDAEQAEMELENAGA